MIIDHQKGKTHTHTHRRECFAGQFMHNSNIHWSCWYKESF